ncbi:2-dehydro-3-deoxy-phosphogluconate aldolase [Chitiniphilus shinanonensis]|nr:KDGP aldolase [Chitiniphilus shinanonensis]
MMLQTISFHRDRVALNVLAHDLDNAVEVHAAAQGHVAVGLLSNRFDSVEEGIAEAHRWQAEVCVSVGLGAGDPAQYYKAAMIAAATAPGHVNQTFTGAGFAAGALAARGVVNTRVNALIRPSGTPGKVIVSTGVAGSTAPAPALVDSDTAVLMIRDLGAHAAKFFPMGGLRSLAELEALARSCARHGLEMIEPTGGIDLANFGDILQVCLDAGVPRVMPHVYSSIIDKETGRTRPEDVAALLHMIAQRV